MVNKRWKYFHKFAADVGIEDRKLAKIVTGMKVGEYFECGETRLYVQKKVHDKYGILYTLSLTDEDANVLRRSPVYIKKPYCRRGLADAYTAIALIALAVASVAMVTVFLADIGDVMVIQESCKISSLEVINTGSTALTELGFVRIVVQNDADRDATLRIIDTESDPVQQVKFYDQGVLQTQYSDTIQERGTFNEGIRIEGPNVKSGEQILLQAELDYGGTSLPLTCTAEAEVR